VDVDPGPWYIHPIRILQPTPTLFTLHPTAAAPAAVASGGGGSGSGGGGGDASVAAAAAASCAVVAFHAKSISKDIIVRAKSTL